MNSEIQLSKLDDFSIYSSDKFIPIKENYQCNYIDVESFIMIPKEKQQYFNIDSDKYYNRRKCFANKENRFYEEVNLFFYDHLSTTSPTQQKNKWNKSKLPINDYFKLIKIQRFFRNKILKIPQIIKLQSCARGFLYRNKLRELSTINKVLEDRFDFLEELLKKRSKLLFMIKFKENDTEPEDEVIEKQVNINDLSNDDRDRLKKEVFIDTIKNYSYNLTNSFEFLTSFDKKPNEYVPSRKISFEVEVFENTRFPLISTKRTIFKDLKFANTEHIIIEKNKKLEIYEVDNNVTLCLNDLDTPTRKKLMLESSEILNCCTMYIPSTPTNKLPVKEETADLFTIVCKDVKNSWKGNLIKITENEVKYIGIKHEPEVIYKEIKKHPSTEFLFSSNGFSLNPNLKEEKNDDHIQILTSSDDEIKDDDLSINNTTKIRIKKAEIKGDLADSGIVKNKQIRIRVKGKNDNEENLDNPLDTQGSYNRDRGILYESFIPRNKPIIPSNVIIEEDDKKEASDNKIENYVEKDLKSKDNYIYSERQSEISSMNKTSNVKFIPENVPDNKDDQEYRISYVPPRKSNYGKLIEKEYNGTTEKEKVYKEKPEKKVIHEDEEFVGARSTTKILEARKLLRKSKQVSEKVIYREYRDKDIFVNERFKTENKGK